MEVSSTSINVGKTTESAMSHGLICCSLLAVKFAISLLLYTAFLIFDRGGPKGACILWIKISGALSRSSSFAETLGSALLPSAEAASRRV
jgi:hypothetical protein